MTIVVLLLWHEYSDARIIDVTTLRDLHVGLPKGSYGFLFRGQRVGNSQNDLSTATSDFVFTGRGRGGNNNSAFVDMVQQGDAVRSCSGSPAGGEANPPREYFCAVSTLEEAQSWVIALQWSVAVCQKTMLRHSINNSDTDIDIDMDIDIDSNIDTDNKISKEKYNNEATSTTVSIPIPIPTSPVADKISLSKSGRVLVTKAYGVRIIRDPLISSTYFNTYCLEIAYEVALLLVEKNNNKVEERRILLTATQLEIMLEEMRKSIRTSLIPFLDDLMQRTEKLPRFTTYNIHSKNKRKNITNWITPQASIASIGEMDGILRSLSMEAIAVNSLSMRRVFRLDVDQPPIEEVCWWKEQRTIYSVASPSREPNSNEMKAIDEIFTPVLFRQVYPILSSISIDNYVRQWLHKPESSSSSLGTSLQTCQFFIQFWSFKRPLLLMSLFGAVFALAYPTWKVYDQHMRSITLRMDFIIVAFYFWYWLGQRMSLSSNERKPLEPSKTMSMRVSKKTAVIKTRNQHVSECDIDPSSNRTPVNAEDIISESSSDDSVLEERDFDDQPHDDAEQNVEKLSSPLPRYPDNDGYSCWSEPSDPSIFHVRGEHYFEDKVKVPSGQSPFKCRGVDLWMTDNPERHIARHPNVLGGRLHEEDTFLVNFLLPFGNFVAYFSVPSISDFPNKEVAGVWEKFVGGDQQYRDARLKLLPVVLDGPWIVRAAVGNGKTPALLGKGIPLQYFFRQPEETKKGVYEVDVIITASSIAKSILNVVKGHTKSSAIAFALIIEASEQDELPETVLCSFQAHFLNLDDCPHLPEFNLDAG